ncbi:MAG: HD domain-containing protein [Ruminococcaceae bacterium]|nr:HD domain-containing protein [Oscillospiraceae bacterium]
MPNNDYAAYESVLKEKLNEKRYHHSLCVAREAERLAVKYSGDPEKCYLAGLLHDITKNISSEEHLKIFNTFGIILTAVEKNAPKLWHAMSGSAYLKHFLNIKDEEILSAVRYHTTAKADMNLTEKILYLADFTSEDRDYPDVDVIRKLVDISLDDAFIYALKFSINDLVGQGRAIHPDTVDAYNQACLGGK